MVSRYLLDILLKQVASGTEFPSDPKRTLSILFPDSESTNGILARALSAKVTQETKAPPNQTPHTGWRATSAPSLICEPNELLVNHGYIGPAVIEPPLFFILSAPLPQSKFAFKEDPHPLKHKKGLVETTSPFSNEFNRLRTNDVS